MVTAPPPVRLRLPRFPDQIERLAYDLRSAGLGKRAIYRHLCEQFEASLSRQHLDILPALRGAAARASAVSVAHADLRIMHNCMTDTEWEAWDGTKCHYHKMLIERLERSEPSPC